jgi:phage terminase large subunit GpA-like protein
MFRKSLGHGCQLSIVAGLSAVGLSMRPIRYLIFEELSRLPLMAKGRAPEGDVVALAKVRTSTFGASAKVIYSSSPVELESCRITALYEDSTQEHYYSRCPAGHYQILALAEMNFETGACRCATCDREYNQLEWLANEGIWRAHGSHPFRRGFHLACWPSPLIDWREVHAAWREAAHLAKAGDHSAMRAVLNTRLAEPFVSSREVIAEDDLAGRREVYQSEVPSEAKLIVAGIDIQDSYLPIWSSPSVPADRHGFWSMARFWADPIWTPHRCMPSSRNGCSTEPGLGVTGAGCASKELCSTPAAISMDSFAAKQSAATRG